MPRASGGGRNTPAAIMASATASTTEAASPCWSSAAAAWFSSPVTQPGSPPVMATIMSCSACGARFAGVSAKYARLPHNTSHSSRAAAAPTARAATNGAVTPARPAGHSSTASSAYKITAPGPPVTGFALPLSTPPRPSPNHHTPSDHAIEAASATRTVGR